MVDFAFSCVVLILFLLFFHIPLTIYYLWIIPIFIIQMIFATGISLIVSAFNLFYRDIQYLLNLVILVWMYLTPIMYPVEIIPEKYKYIMSLNPMAVIINAYRQVILSGKSPSTDSLAIALGVSLVIFAIGFAIFKKLEGKFADYV